MFVFSAMTNAPTEKTIDAIGAPAIAANVVVVDRWIVSAAFAAMVELPNWVIDHCESVPLEYPLP